MSPTDSNSIRAGESEEGTQAEVASKPDPGLYLVATPIGNAADITLRALSVLLERLGSGETIALVSDAGTPLISDPGYKLVRECVAAGLPVTTLPGACAPVTALVLSGLPSDRFLFAGFLPPKSAARRSAAHELMGLKATLIW